MNENTAVVLNLQSPNISTVVYAVQNDRLSRHITAQLLDGAAPWTPPAGASAAIRYLKPDGTAGFYDTDEAGNDAITISGSVATLTIAEQALTVPGDVYMQLNFYTTNEERLTTFSWLLRVQKSVIEDAEIVSSDYFNALTEKIAQGIEVAQQLTFPVPIMNGGTDAETEADACNNLHTLNLSTGETVIPANSDLDNYKTPGNYAVGGSADAASILHTPVTDRGYKLIVMYAASTVFVRQIALTKGNAGIYARSYSNNTSSWTAWGRLLDTNDLPLSIANGGTDATDAATARGNLGLSYNTGDTFAIPENSIASAPFAGYAYSATELRFLIYTDKYMDVNPTITGATGRIVDANGTLDGTSGSTNYVTDANWTVTVARHTRTAVVVSLKKSSNITGLTATTPVMLFGRITLSF